MNILNVFDVSIFLILALFIIIGFKNGVIKEIVSLVGIILIFIIAYKFKGYIGNILCLFLPFFDFSSAGNLVFLNVLLYQALGFLIIFVVLFGILSIFIKISKIIQKIINVTIIFWLPSKLAGALVSFIKGYVIVFAVLFVLMVPLKGVDAFNDSKLVNAILFKSPILTKKTESFSTSINEIYDLSMNVLNKNISEDEANLQSLDIMLKYKITDKQNISNLLKIRKVKKINGIDNILNKY